MSRPAMLLALPMPCKGFAKALPLPAQRCCWIFRRQVELASELSLFSCPLIDV